MRDDSLARLRGVLDLGRTLANEQDLETLCGRVLDTCFALLDADRGAVVLYEPSSMAPFVSVTRDREGRPFALAACALGRQVDRTPSLHTDVDRDSSLG